MFITLTLYFLKGIICSMKIESVYREIGAVIRGKRRERNLSQEKLAARLGIKRATLANIETGRQRILVHMLYSFANALDIKPTDLLPTTPSTSHWTDFPFESENLNSKQKQEIANLISQIDGSSVIIKKLYKHKGDEPWKD